MCRMEKLMPEWAVSMFQLLVVMGLSSGRGRVQDAAEAVQRASLFTPYL